MPNLLQERGSSDEVLPRSEKSPKKRHVVVEGRGGDLNDYQAVKELEPYLRLVKNGVAMVTNLGHSTQTYPDPKHPYFSCILNFHQSIDSKMWFQLHSDNECRSEGGVGRVEINHLLRLAIGFQDSISLNQTSQYPLLCLWRLMLRRYSIPLAFRLYVASNALKNLWPAYFDKAFRHR
ncbi:hypothetical protein Ancab_019006 [Ancistrocladus abbreviatus]